MSNVFLGSYFQAPDDLVKHLPAIKRLGSMKLLILVLQHAQRYSSMTVKLSTREIRAITGMAPHSLGSAREELDTLSLLRSREIDNAGTWEYTLLEPGTGRERLSRKTQVDFNQLEPAQVLTYFLKRLLPYDPVKRSDDTYRARCPLHRSLKQQDRTLEFGVGDGGGVWYCHRCHKSGSMVDLEIALSLRENNASITKKTAHSKVRAIVLEVSELEDEPTQI